MPLKHSPTCLRCGGTNWFPHKHWMICADCEPEIVADLQAAEVYPIKPVLLQRGIPRRPGP